MGTIEEGAKIAVNKCMRVQPGDRVLIISDEQSKDIGMYLRKATLDVTRHVRFFNIDLPAYGGRPLQRMPDGLEEAIQSSTVTFLVARAMPGELPSFREPLLQLVKQNARHAHMVSVTEEIMKTGMCADYDVIEKITEKVYEMVRYADEIRVTSPAGSDFVVKLDPGLKWIPCSGVVTKRGDWDNLPSGEVFTAPMSLEGRLVVDGAVGDWIGLKYNGSIDYSKMPLVIDVEIENGGSYVKQVTCEHDELLADFIEYIGNGKNASRASEIGIGTNIFLDKTIGNILQDEKLPTVHIAFGDPYSMKTGANWSCGYHIDLVMLKCSIEVDGKVIMKDGQYIKEIMDSI